MDDEELEEGEEGYVELGTSYEGYLKNRPYSVNAVLPAGKEDWINGKIKRVQLQTAGGRFGPNIVSGGVYNKQLGAAIGKATKEVLLQNYDTMIDEKRYSNVPGEKTGALRRSIEQGRIESNEDGTSLGYTYYLDGLVSRDTRSNRSRGKSKAENVEGYGPLVFFGRREISGKKMVFPSRGGGKLIAPRRSGATLPKNIFKLTPEQGTHIANSAAESVTKLMQQNINDMIKDSNGE